MFCLCCCLGSCQSETKNVSKELNLTKPTYGNNISTGGYKMVQGVRIYFETYGEGDKCVLMLHGNCGSIHDFENQIPYFSNEYKVVVVDSRSHGKSLDTSSRLNYDLMAEDINLLLDSLKMDSLNIIGFSDGGIIALILAGKHPEKVCKMAISGANLRPDSSVFNTGVYNWMNSCISELKNGKEIEAKEMIKKIRMMQLEPHISIKELQQIKCPVLIISGDHDAIKVSHAVEIFENLSNAYLWIEPGTGHSTIVTHKDIFNQKVDSFFATPFKRITWMN